MTIRPPDDVGLSEMAILMPRYMSEAYGAEWHGSVQALRTAVAAGALRILIARRRAMRIAGFIAWTSAYDLHWCATGGTVLDLYVCPEARGHAVAIRLLAAAANRVCMNGGTFLRGTAIDTGSGRKLYGRAAVCDATAECTIGGRALRELAALEQMPSRELVQRLPAPTSNYHA